MSSKKIKSVEEMISILKKHEKHLREEYGVKSIGIFGSAVRGELKEDSDIDVLVEFESPISLFKFLELEEYLEKILGRKVDLVSKKALKPNIGKRILREVVSV